MTFILVNETVYETDSIEQIDSAQEALREAGLSEAPVYAGDPEGDNHRNGQVLFAE